MVGSARAPAVSIGGWRNRASPRFFVTTDDVDGTTFPTFARVNTGRCTHVVVIGSGFGGLFTTKALAGVGVDITLTSRTSLHLFAPLLYQVATGILSEGEIAPSTREILARQAERPGFAG